MLEILKFLNECTGPRALFYGLLMLIGLFMICETISYVAEVILNKKK